MTRRYAALEPHQQKVHDELDTVLQKLPTAEWFEVLEAFFEHAQVEALSKVPYEGPYPMNLQPFQD